MTSVIIPAYNRATTIERSIRSVLKQTVSDLEVIVVDDCSDDALEEVVQGIDDKRVRYVRLAQRSGACVARNKGIDEAKGDYIAFQDSDDAWLPDKLAMQLKAMEENHADISFCMLQRHYIGENAKVVAWPSHLEQKSDFIDHTVLRRRSCVSTQTIVAKRHVFDNCRFDPLVSKGQDYDWSIRASQNYPVYFLAVPLVEQYLQKDSISMSGYEKFVESRTYFLEKYKDICETDLVFKLYLLQQIAHYKVLSGMNAAKEYGEIYRLQKNTHNLVCAVLAKVNLIRFFVK